MPASRLKLVFLSLVTIVIAYAAVIALSSFGEKHRPPLPVDLGDADLTLNGARLKGFALGTESLIADWYFMRALQYIGDKIESSKSNFINIDDLSGLNPRLLYPLLNNATDLDPQFYAAYAYGAIVLPAIDPAEAIALTKKGIANNPTNWRLYQHLGYIYWKLKRFDVSSEIYDKGGDIAGAPPFMKLMAASMRSDGERRSTARLIYSQMLDTSSDPQMIDMAKRRVAELDELDERDAINKALTDRKTESGRCPRDLGELIPWLMKIDLPGDAEFHLNIAGKLVDPTGEPYSIDDENCSLFPDPENPPDVKQ